MPKADFTEIAMKFQPFSLRNHLAKDVSEPFDAMSDELRNALWNIIEPVLNVYEERFVRRICQEVFRCSADDLVYSTAYRYHINIEEFHKYYDDLKWHQVYDILEYLMLYYRHAIHYLGTVRQNVNNALEQYNAAYHLVDDVIAPLTNRFDVNEIEEALVVLRPINGSAQHLHNALEAFSKRPLPDHGRVLLEARTAFEKMVRLLADDYESELPVCLGKIRDQKNVYEGPDSIVFDIIPILLIPEERFRQTMNAYGRSISYEHARFYLIQICNMINFLKRFVV